MAYLRLYNQEIDTSVEQQINDNYDIDKIKRMWRHKYGKILDKCTIEIIGKLNRKHQDGRTIINNKNGEKYITPTEASIALKVTPQTILRHLKKLNNSPFDYLVKYEGDDND